MESIATIIRRRNFASDVLQLVNRSGSSNRIQTIESEMRSRDVAWVLMMQSNVDLVSSRVIGRSLQRLNVVSVWHFLIGRFFVLRVALTYFGYWRSSTPRCVNGFVLI